MTMLRVLIIALLALNFRLLFPEAVVGRIGADGYFEVTLPAANAILALTALWWTFRRPAGRRVERPRPILIIAFRSSVGAIALFNLLVFTPFSVPAHMARAEYFQQGLPAVSFSFAVIAFYCTVFMKGRPRLFLKADADRRD